MRVVLGAASFGEIAGSGRYSGQLSSLLRYVRILTCGGWMGIVARLVLKTTLVAMTVAAPSFAFGQTREEITRQPVSPVTQSAGEALDVNSDVERAPCPLAAPEFASVPVTIQTVDFGNMRGIDPEILRPAYQAYVGKPVPVATVCEIRDTAATILRRRGYLAAVQVPAQRIENGHVRFDVLLAKIVDFQVRGNAGRTERLISRYLSAIKDAEVFNIVDAERYLLLARDIPGFDVRLTLRPAGTVPGEVIGEVLVNYTPVDAVLNVQNYGSHETGRFGGLAQARYNGLIGAGDRTTIGYYATADFKEQHVAQFGEEVRVGREGLTLAGNFTYAWTRPSIDPTIDLRSRTWVATFEARYPLIRRQTRNLALAGGLDAINQRVAVGGVPFTQDRLRVGFIRLDYDSIDPNSVASIAGYSAPEPRWRFGGGAELRQGLGVLGNSKDCGPTLARCANPAVVPISHLEADTTAFVARANAIVEFRPVPKFAVVTLARAQYARRPLMSYEEFSAGNFSTGRGYDPGIIIGDSGVGLTGELRYGSLVPRTNASWAFQAYGFTDAVWVWNRDLTNPTRSDRLVSAGGGVRVAYGNRFNLDVGGAFPLKRAGLQTQRADPRVLVNLTVKLLPWKQR